MELSFIYSFIYFKKHSNVKKTSYDNEFHLIWYIRPLDSSIISYKVLIEVKNVRENFYITVALVLNVSQLTQLPAIFLKMSYHLVTRLKILVKKPGYFKIIDFI